MKKTLTLCLASLILLPAQAGRRVGEAQVRTLGNGLPCFTISEREEERSGTPDFQSITVSEGERVLWYMAMPRHRTFPVTASMCIPYGGRVPALPQTPAGTLGEDRVYAVQIEVRPGGEAAMPLRYGARFCLTRQGLAGPWVRPPGADGRTACEVRKRR